MYKRIALFLLLAVVMALPAQNMKAESEVIPVTGICYMLGEWEEDDFRFWSNPNWTVVHWRHNMFLFWCDASDDRLDGYFVFRDSWNLFSNENNPFQSREFANGFSSDIDGNPTGLWEISSSNYWDWAWNFTSKMNYKGRNAYQGLHADMIMTNDADGNYPIAGELHITGN